MSKLAFAALCIGVVTSCGGDKKDPVDAMTPDGALACSPLTQSGCAPGEKCTWVFDVLLPAYAGHIGCAPDGTAAVGDACMFGSAGATGYDACKKGAVCGNYRGGAGVCKQLCDPQGGALTCDAQHVCTSYANLFATSDTTMPALAGVCDATCDPLTDNDFDGSATTSMKTTTACGTTEAVGCYGYPSFGSSPATAWSCADDINAAEAQPTGLRHRVQCTETNKCADAGPTIYVNSCNQGYLPLLQESTLVSTTICVALCRPATCFAANCSINELNRLGTGGHVCKSPERLGSLNVSVTNANADDHGEHCRYMWSFEIDDQGNYLPSATSNSVGFCFDHGKYQYDSDGDNIADKDLPACGLLKNGFGSGTNPADPLTYFGAADLGCVDTAMAGLAQGDQLPADTLRKIKTGLPRALNHRTMATR
jgi:hypothetical protein